MIYQTNSLNWFTLLIVLIIATYCVLHPLIQAKLSTLHHARLNHHGVTLPQPVISTAVEKAYQLYKHLVTGDQHLDL
ncbi:hypothetical protein [Levilactobacillus brevis]|nr:hypothetical protein [Levilactobacillus brevis]